MRNQKEILDDIERTKNCGLTAAIGGFNPYSIYGSKLDRLYEELEDSQKSN